MEAEPWVAVKFSSKWVFANPEDLKETSVAVVVRKDDLNLLSFEDVVGTFN